MNKRRMRALAKRIAQMPRAKMDRSDKKCTVRGFRMDRYSDDCGTPCCIAGWAASDFLKKNWNPRMYLDVHKVATQRLGLNEEEAMTLFDPGCGFISLTYTKVTPKDAARALMIVVSGETDPAIVWARAIARQVRLGQLTPHVFNKYGLKVTV